MGARVSHRLNYEVPALIERSDAGCEKQLKEFLRPPGQFLLLVGHGGLRLRYTGGSGGRSGGGACCKSV
jgi:hypothetical protein